MIGRFLQEMLGLGSEGSATAPNREALACPLSKG